MLDVVFLEKNKTVHRPILLVCFFFANIFLREIICKYIFSQLNYFTYFKRDKKHFFKILHFIYILFSIVITFF